MHASDLKTEWESYLGFLMDVDLDNTFEAEPINRTLSENKSAFAPSVAAVRQNVMTSAPAAIAARTVLTDIAALKAEAKQRATAARTLDELYAEWQAFRNLPVRKEGAKQLVKARGAERPTLLIVGEAPDEEEDQQGLAFVGKPGQLMTRAAIAAGMAEKVLMTPCIAYRPAGGRPLTSEDTAINAPYLQSLIRLAAPKAVLMLGAAAVSMTINVEGPLAKVRGRLLQCPIEGSPTHVPAVASFAPGFLLQNPAAKAVLWTDLLNLVATLPQT